MKLHGITLVKNGELLGYPYKLVIQSLQGLCDEVWVNVDPTSEDDTLEQVKRTGANVVESVWDMSCTGDGSMLANQANLLLENIPDGDIVVYLQADEVLHENDEPYIKSSLQATLEDDSGEPYTTWELYREYFWGDLSIVRRDWSMFLARIFKKGCAVVDGDGMGTNRLTGRAYRLQAVVHHYSRIGDPVLISRRVSVLDKLFHPHDTVPDSPPPYDFETREFDCYSTEESPEVKEKALLGRFYGVHPKGVKEFYNV